MLIQIGLYIFRYIYEISNDKIIIIIIQTLLIFSSLILISFKYFLLS
jgi:hypothetical protein